MFNANNITKSKNAEFFDSIFPKKDNVDKTMTYVKVNVDLPKSSNNELRRSKRMRKTTSFGNDFYAFLMEEYSKCSCIKWFYNKWSIQCSCTKKFDNALILNNFIINDSDKCLYYKTFNTNRYVIIYLYVDDMLIFSLSIEVIVEIKSFLLNVFVMKDLGETDVILGVKIMRTSNGFTLT